MNKVSFFIFLVFLVFSPFFLFCQVYKSQGGIGLEFYIPFPRLANKQDARLAIYVVNNNTQLAQYQIEINSTVVNGGSVPPGDVTTPPQIIDPNALNIMAGNSNTRNGVIKVSSLNNTPIAVYAILYTKDSTSIVNVLPRDIIGFNYTVATYHSDPSGSVKDPTSSSANLASTFIQIVGTKDDTKIKITPSANDVSGVFIAGMETTVIVDEDEVLTIESLGDLTGSIINVVSNLGNPCSPIAVFAGSSGMPLGCDLTRNGTDDEADNLFVQIVPEERLGTTYFVVPYKNYPAVGDTFRVVALYPSTEISFSDGSSNETLANKGDYFSRSDVRNPVQITANKPVLVTQLMPSLYCEEDNRLNRGAVVNYPGDSELTILAPIENAENTVFGFGSFFTILSLFTTDINSNINMTTLTVIISKEDKDNVLINNAKFGRVEEEINNTDYVALRYSFNDISNNSVSNILSIKANKPFLYHLFGVGTNGINSGESFVVNSVGTLRDSYLNIEVESKNALFVDASAPNNVNVCTGDEYQFIVTTPIASNLIMWDVGGTVVNQTNPTPYKTLTKTDGSTLYQYAHPKTFTVSTIGENTVSAFINRDTNVNPITADECLFNATVSLTYQIYESPIVDLVLEQNYCLDQILYFDDRSIVGPTNTDRDIRIVKRYWRDNFGFTSDKLDPQLSYNSLGTKNVSLAVADNKNCFSNFVQRSTDIIDVTPSFTTTNALCAFNDIVFEDNTPLNSALGFPVTRTWNILAASAVSNTIYSRTVVGLTTYTPVPVAAPDTYTISMMLQYSRGCVSSISNQSFFFNPSPIVDIIIPEPLCRRDTNIDFGSTAYVPGFSNATFTYSWRVETVNSFEYGNTKTLTLAVVPQRGENQLFLIVDSSVGCASTRQEAFFAHGSVLLADFFATEGFNICGNESIVFENNSNIADDGYITSVDWYFDYDTNPNQKLTITDLYENESRTTFKPIEYKYPETPVSTTKVYKVRLVARTGRTCKSDPVEREITVRGVPDISIHSLTALCQNDPPIGLNHYQYVTERYNSRGGWRFSEKGGNIPQTGDVDPATLMPDVYTILVTFTADNLCQDYTSGVLTISAIPTVDLPPRMNLFIGESTVFSYTYSNDIITQTWTENIPPVQRHLFYPSFVPLKTDIYTLTLLNDVGCMHAQSILIRVYDDLELPTGITPNNDGFNDRWVLDEISDQFPNSIISIFDRNGRKVYEDFVGKFWEGKRGGKVLNPGVYFYSLNIDDHRIIYKGYVVIY